MRIADRYIVREIAAPFLLGVGGFVVLLVGDILYVLAEFLATRRITGEALVRLLMYKLPAIMVVTFPVSTLFGTLLGLARLAKDHELRALRLSGLSLTRIFAPVLVFGAITAAAAFLTNEYFAPWANGRANAIVRQAAFGEAVPPVHQQVFFRAPGNRVFYVDRIDRDQVLHDLMVYELAGSLPRLITARRATWTGRALHLSEGVVRELDADGFSRYEARFASLELAVDADRQTVLAGQRTPDEMTARELRQYLTLFGQDGATSRFALEFHRKFAVPLAGVVFVLLAAPLSIYTAQGGRFLGVGASIAVLFVYYAVMSAGRAIAATGGMAPGLAAWLPNLLFGSVGSLLWVWQDGWGVFTVRPRGTAGDASLG